MNKQNKGFTLIEIGIVLTICAIMAALLLPSIATMRERGEKMRKEIAEKEAQAEIEQAKAELEEQGWEQNTAINFEAEQLKQEAVRRGYAQYNPMTGQWEWLDEPRGY